MAVGLCALAGCGGAIGTAPPAERYLVHESPSGFVAYGVAGDGTVVSSVSGTADELGAFADKARRETGIAMVRCEPSPTSDVGTPIPCPPGPTGQGGGSGSGGGQTRQ